jgi:hypothetical protein
MYYGQSLLSHADPAQLLLWQVWLTGNLGFLPNNVSGLLMLADTRK